MLFEFSCGWEIKWMLIIVLYLGEMDTKKVGWIMLTAVGGMWVWSPRNVYNYICGSIACSLIGDSWGWSKGATNVHFDMRHDSGDMRAMPVGSDETCRLYRRFWWQCWVWKYSDLRSEVCFVRWWVSVSWHFGLIVWRMTLLFVSLWCSSENVSKVPC